jgi:hypothetical protein
VFAAAGGKFPDEKALLLLLTPIPPITPRIEPPAARCSASILIARASGSSSCAASLCASIICICISTPRASIAVFVTKPVPGPHRGGGSGVECHASKAPGGTG